jgi:SOS-response transcriptional repressor LexA
VTNNKNQATSDLRRRDLETFIAARGLKVARWAREAGISEGTIRNFLMKRSETLTQATVDALAMAVGVAASVIFPSHDAKRKGGRASNLTFLVKSHGSLGARNLPIIHAVRSGAGLKLDRGHTARLTERPAYLRGVKSSYALRILDRSMSPAFEPGWLVYVDPSAAAKPGDNVVAELGDGTALVRRLVRKAKAGVVLRQFNPKKDTEVKAARLGALHAIAGVRYRK